jgi:poly(A) polymerase
MDQHPQAKFIVETLAQAGFVAYYAGGWVRDLLLNHPSDDIDIATNAPPETIQTLFPHTIPVGIAFGIVIVILDQHQYEVATFRQDIDYKDGRRPTRIEFTTAEEDAKRRDFTINGMFYDPIKEQILDYVNGRADLKAKIIRAIGNPHQRIKEDRLRMIRGVRLACRFGFQIEEATEKAIRAHAEELFPAVAIERVWQELKKGYDFGSLHPMLLQLHELGLLSTIFPDLKGVSVTEIEHRIGKIREYPSNAPLIASLLSLFPGYSFDQQLDLCKTFKLPNVDRQFVTFLDQAHTLTQTTHTLEPVEWAYFYANDWSLLSLQIISASLDPQKKVLFLKEHQERQESLEKSIQRIRRQNPLIKAADLLRLGIQPGVTMGALLKEAERIAINEQIEESAPLLERLKKLPIWPK